MKRLSRITEPVDMPLEEVDIEAALAAYERVFAHEAAAQKLEAEAATEPDPSTGVRA